MAQDKLLTYWKPIAVFWALLLATFWLIHFMQPKWKFSIQESIPYRMVWSNQRGEAFVSVGGNWEYIAIEPERKHVSTQAASGLRGLASEAPHQQ